jgi:hypothetical protein
LASTNKATQKASFECDVMTEPRRKDKPTDNLSYSDVTVVGKPKALVRNFALRLLFVTVTGEHRQAGILEETRVREREFTENENRFAGRFDAPRVITASAEPGGRVVIHIVLFLFHKRSISQETAIADAGAWWLGARSGRRTLETVMR